MLVRKYMYKKCNNHILDIFLFREDGVACPTFGQVVEREVCVSQQECQLGITVPPPCGEEHLPLL